VHYFALFNAKCLTSREKDGALSAPDLAILCRALHNDHTFSLGAIIARRLHLNSTKGKIHGGIYATSLASHFNVQIRQHDYPLPRVYLDHQALVDYQFIDTADSFHNIRYNLVFSVETRDIIPLPAPALFDSIARGGYRVMPEDIIAYRNDQAVAKEEPQDWDTQVPPP
jgi:hypothetical protein